MPPHATPRHATFVKMRRHAKARDLPPSLPPSLPPMRPHFKLSFRAKRSEFRVSIQMAVGIARQEAAGRAQLSDVGGSLNPHAHTRTRAHAHTRTSAQARTRTSAQVRDMGWSLNPHADLKFSSLIIARVVDDIDFVCKEKRRRARTEAVDQRLPRRDCSKALRPSRISNEHMPERGLDNRRCFW